MEPLLLSKPDSISDKIAREGALIAGAALNICDGIRNAARDAWNNPEKSTKLIADAAAGGLAIALIAKNPAILGKGLQPVCEFGIAHGGKIGALLITTDLSQRVASPLTDTWRSADGLNSNKQILSDKLGSAVVDYTLLGAGGFAGAKYGPTSLKYFRDLVGKNLVAQPAYAFAAATPGTRNLTELGKPDSALVAHNPSAKDLVVFNEGKAWKEIQLTGKTHLAKPGQTAIEGRRGDIVLHTPESGKNYIGVKVLEDSFDPNKISTLKDFDIRDVIAKSHVNFKSESHRQLNIQIIKDAMSKMTGESILRRDIRHHGVDFSDDWVQYRLRTPAWLDPTERAPQIKLPFSGRVTECEPVRPAPGDLYMSEKLDIIGAENKYLGYGRQCGEFALNVYDNELWSHKFNLRDFLYYHTDLADPRRLFYFHTKQDMVKTWPRMLETLQAYIQKDAIAYFNHNPKKRMFEIR